MTVEEIFQELAAHMLKGTMIHSQMSVAYGFLNLYGYQKCHEYHYCAENKNYRCVQKYYLEHYNKMIHEKEAEKPNLIPDNWYKYSKQEVDINTKRSAIKELMKTWVNWETETKNLLQVFYKELYEIGEICAALKIKKFLEDVDKELNKAQMKYINLETIGYDISAIVKEQKNLYEEFHKKIKTVYKD